MRTTFRQIRRVIPRMNTIQISKDGEGHDAVLEMTIHGETEMGVYESIREAWAAAEKAMKTNAIECPDFSGVDVETERHGYSWVSWESET